MNRRMSGSVVAAALVVVALVVTGLAGPGLANAKSRVSTKAKPALTTYLVISPHTPEQCLEVLDAVSGAPNGRSELAKWEWGCKGGDHTGYLEISAASPEDALSHVPEAERSQARAVPLNRFTPDEIRSFHQMKK
jgi:hypothetical protein